MPQYLLAHDLGTSGNKTTLFDTDALKRTSEFVARTTPKQTRVLDRTVSPAKLLAP